MGKANLAASLPDVAKNDLQLNRAAVLLGDEGLGAPLRPELEEAPRPERRSALRSGQEAPLPPERAAGEEDGAAALPVRRRTAAKKTLLPRSRSGRWLMVAGIGVALVLFTAGTFAMEHFFEHDPRFLIGSADDIQVAGNTQVTRGELLNVFGEDIGRNIFFVPLRARRTELEGLPWVKHATVMRLLPDRLRIDVVERTPVAFVRRGSRVGLVDANGVILSMPPAMMAARRYSFPVVTGISAGQDPELRANRMRLYEQFIGDLNADGGKAEQVSEVDLSDPEDVRATIPMGGKDLLVHFGEGDFAHRFQVFASHVAGWQLQYPDLAGVDLRYEHQTVLQMSQGVDAAAPASDGAKPSAAHAAPPQSAASARPQKAARKPAHAASEAAKRSGKSARPSAKSQRVSARG